MKKCTKCNILTDNFPKRKTGKNGLSSFCRACHNKILKIHHRTKKGLTCQIYNGQKSSSKRRNHKLPTYSMQELREWLFSQKKFHELYNNWKNSGYKKNLIPSVDRIDNDKGYSFDNIKLMTWRENMDNAHRDAMVGKLVCGNLLKPIIQFDLKNNKINEFNSLNEAMRKTGVYSGNISSCCRQERKTAGGFIWKHKK